MFSFVRSHQTIFQSGCTIFAFPPAVRGSCCCSTSLSAFGVVSVLDFHHSNSCVVVSHCCFNLQYHPCCFNLFDIFSYAYLPSMSSLAKYLFRCFAHFYLLIFLFLFLGLCLTEHGVLVPWPGIKPRPPAL